MKMKIFLGEKIPIIQLSAFILERDWITHFPLIRNLYMSHFRLSLGVVCEHYLHFLLFCLRWAHVGVFDHFHDIHTVIFTIGKTSTNEIFGLGRYCRLIRKLDICCFQNNIFFQDGCLGLIMTKRLKNKEISQYAFPPKI